MGYAYDLEDAYHGDLGRWVRGAEADAAAATPGKATNAAGGGAVAAVPPAMLARLTPYVGEEIADNSGITYVVTPQNAFEITKAPEKWRDKVMGRVIAADGPWASTWQNLARLIEARAARQPKPEAGPQAPAQTQAQAQAQAQTQTPAEKPALTKGVDPAIAGAPHGGSAMDANLLAAKNAADALTIPHTYDRKKEFQVAPLKKDAKLTEEEQAARDEQVQKDTDRRAAVAAEEGPNATAIRTGDLEGLTSIVCSGFTALSLRRAGIDLDQPFHDKATGLKVAVKDGSIKWVTLYGVLQNFPAHTIAAMKAKRRDLPRIEPDSPEHKALGGFKSTEAFLYCSDEQIETPAERAQAWDKRKAAGESAATLGKRPDGTTWAVEVRAGDAFGAGAAAMSLGGVEVAQAERRPGDIQQRLDVASGKASFAGHSSTVWMVRGPGIAYLGAEGSPKLVGAPAKTQPAPGWYRVEGGATIELDPSTDPARVARCDVGTVQLIEANTKGAKGDATGVGTARAADAAFDPDAKDSDLTSTGRLPTSKWLGWKPSSPDVVGIVTSAGIQSGVDR